MQILPSRVYDFSDFSKLLLCVLVVSIIFCSAFSQTKTYSENFEGNTSDLDKVPWILWGGDNTVEGTVMGTGSASIVNDPNDPRNRVMKIDKKVPPPGERYDVVSSREEILYLSNDRILSRIPDAFPRWFRPITYRWRFYFTDDHDWDKPEHGNFGVASWHHSTQVAISGGAPASFRVQGNDLKFKAKWASPKNPDNSDVKESSYHVWSNLKKNTWYYIIVDITWDYREGKTGQIKAYMRAGSWPNKSDLVLDHSGSGKAIGYNYRLTNYAQIGGYMWRWRTPKGADQSRKAGVKKFEFLIDDWEYTQGKHSFSNSNQPPEADAGLDQTITLPKNTITLNGSGNDPDGTITKYQWIQKSGPNNAKLNKEHTPNLEVDNLQAGTYVFRLTVKDNNGESDSDDVLVIVNQASNQDPNADAGQDETITLPKNQVTLKGAGTDSDGTVDDYKWTQVSGPSNATLKGENSADLQASDLKSGEYVFRLNVTDDDGATDTDNVKVTVKEAPNQDPSADAGQDKTITLPKNQVTFNGAGNDSDGSVDDYEWTQVSGPSNATLKGENTADLQASDLQAGEYVFRLKVTDNDGATDTDNVKVTVKEAPNQDPNADAGDNKTITLPNDKIALQGSGNDPDGTIDIIKWTQQSGPSNANLKGEHTFKVEASNLVEGKYVFRLTVTDNTGAKDSDDVIVTVNPKVNESPSADAGSNKNLTLPNNQITIEGSGTDPDGTIESYSWKQASGPSNATLSGQNTPALSASDLVEGSYVFRLTVTDNEGATDQDDMQVIVNAAAVNESPSANAGANQTIILPNNQVTLNGDSSDPDGTIDSFQWTQESGPSTASLSGETTKKLTASDLQAGKYVFKLTVTDDGGESSSDNVTVNVKPAPNQAPSADAGPNKTIILPNNNLTITGSANDADGNIVSYLWSQSSGPSTAGMENKDTEKFTASNLNAGTYVFKLTVTDNSGATAEDEMQVVVRNAVVTNEPPKANAGANKTITLPTNQVALTGSGSDGSIASYEWEQITGTSATLEGANSAKLEVSDLIAGIYEFQLTVIDNQGDTDSDQVRITVLEAPPAISANIVDATCDADDGAIALTIDRGKGPFAFQWSHGVKSKDLSNISSGEYQVKVTDANGNSVSKAFTVNSNNANLQIDATVKNATCNNNNGSIQVQASGGTAPYSYEWSSNARSSNLSSLAAGSYNLVVKDQNGCSKKFSFEVEIDPGEVEHDVSSSIQNASCASDDGSIALKVNGSNGPYSYVWDHGATGPILNSLTFGKYQVVITDKHGCFTKAEYIVNQDPGPTKPVISQSGDSLYVLHEASTYQWFKDSVAIAGANQRSFKYTEAGTYSVQISNSQTCTASSDYFYAQDPPAFSVFADNNFTIQKVEIYPNPAIQDINVNLYLNEPAATNITIYDFQGRIMYTHDLGIINSQVSENLRVDQFSSGTFLIRVKANQEVLTRRFIKH